MQEELRKRNLYFGDINGQATPDLANSLKRYQARKGFPATGTIDVTTAASLNVAYTAAPPAEPAPLPDIPILKSDFARRIPSTEIAARENEADKNPDFVPTPPPPPAEAPPASQDLSPQRITDFVQSYLADSETNEIEVQTTKYFSYPVNYFDDGPQDAAHVKRDVGYYLRNFPKRKYRLLGPVQFTASEEEDETKIQFEIAYDLENRKRQVAGRTRNYWTVRAQKGDLKIVSIQEERLRE